MDDICPQMDKQKFLEYKTLFDKFGIKPLLGIIPDNKDNKLKIEDDDLNFWEMIRQLQQDGWAIAQHGYQHVFCSYVEGILTRRRLSEFAGLSYEEQVDKIIKGKKILEENGVSTDIFMAPGHSFDAVTLRALKDCGFHYVTDGFSSLPYMYCGIKFIPCRLVSPIPLPGINTWSIHSNTWSKKDFNRIERSLKTQYAHSFHDIQNIPCFNTFFCQKEEKAYKYFNRFIIIPLISLKKRIFKWIRIKL